MTANAAVAGIRSRDRSGSIALFSLEPDPPYNRPPLTKGLWQGQQLHTIWLPDAREGVDLHLERGVVSLDRAARRVVDDRGEGHGYRRLLLATGGAPRRLPFGEGLVSYYRTLADYRRLRAEAGSRRRFAVIGGGFIGCELAAALTMNGQEVVMLFPDEGLGARVFPRELSLFLNDYYREKGVEVLSGASVTAVEARGGRRVLRARAADGSEHDVEADSIIAGIGIVPSTGLAESAGLETANGIVADRFLRTSDPDIYAAGDVASFPNETLGMRLRVEHEDTAVSMGRAAGANMAGAETPYERLP
jgi:3-phenylpropionate/trans-cinnamate dioxygenase ferredoxin reductase subunit